MNKIVKGFCIAAVCLILIGSLLCVGGLAAGGVGAATGIMTNIFERHGLFGATIVTTKEKYAEREDHKADFAADMVKNLKIETGAAEVELMEGSKEDTVSISASGRMIETKLEDGTLLIENKISSVHGGEGDHIVIEIPKDFQFDRVTISVGASDIYAESVNANLLELEIDAGKAEFQKLRASRAVFDNGAGEIAVRDGYLKSCEAHIDMGSFEYEGVLYDGMENADCKVDCGMGSAKFRLKGSPEDYNYSVDCSIGNVKIGGEHYSGLEHRNHINHHADSTFNIDCSVGTVVVEFEGENTNEKIDKVL